MFRACDTDHKGAFSVDKFKKFLKSMNLNLNTKEIYK